MLCGYVPAIIRLDDRLQYYNAINTSELNTPENFAVFLGQSCIRSLELAIKAAKGENIEVENDLDEALRSLQQRIEGKKDDSIVP